MQQEISVRYYQWLTRAIEDWQNQNLISKDQGEKIANYYKPQSDSAFITVLVGILASILIGGGIILLVAHNWQGFSQNVRAVISFFPLLISQAILWWAYPRGVLARESAGVMHTLSIGASIALVSQTFHYAGDLHIFIRAWLLLLLPVAVLYRAESFPVAVLSLGMWFSGLASLDDNIVNLYVVLIVAIAFGYVAWRGNRIITRWFYVMYVTWLIHQVLDAWSFLPYLALISLLSSIYYVVGVVFQPTDNYWRNPLRLIGSIGVFFLAVGFCFFFEELFLRDKLVIPYAPLVVVTILGVLAWAVKTKRMAWQQSLYASIPLVFLLLEFVVHQDIQPLFKVILYWGVNIFILLTGVWLSIQGQSQARIGKMNVALLLVASVVLARFFDADDSFLTRGVLFIVAGIALFVFNFYYLKRQKGVKLTEAGFITKKQAGQGDT